MANEGVLAKKDISIDNNKNSTSIKPYGSNALFIIGLVWAIFQLFIDRLFIIDEIYIRSIHLSFAMTFVFVYTSVNKQSNSRLRHFINYALALIAGISALYITLDWPEVSKRSSDPLILDLISGSVLVLLLLEGTRRSVGAALPIIAIVFSVYAFIAPYLPGVFSHNGVDFNKYLSQTSLSAEGIYGIPLDVSASIVYLFVLFGSIMDKSGAGKFFIDLSLSLLGRFRGGPAKAAVVSSGLTGMISGSSIANIVTTGTFTIPLMKKIGYPAKKAAATEVAASTDGQLMPPIMGAAAFIIAEYVNVSYIEVVKAAIIPALVSYFALFYITHLEALKLGMRGLTKEDLRSIVDVLKEGFYYLIPIGLMVYELIILRHSPQNAAFLSILCLMGVILIREVIKQFISVGQLNIHTITRGLKEGFLIIISGMVDGSKKMVPVALATAAAGIIVGIVGIGIGTIINNVVIMLSAGNIVLLLLVTAIACLVLGMGLPTTATYIVMAVITAPIITGIGADYGLYIPLMAAHLFCFYFGILADDTPPVGLAAYTAAAIAQSDPIRTGIQGFIYDLRTAVIPFMFIFNTELILYGINSWLSGILVFAMAVIGSFAFTSALQGWYVTKNKWYEIPLFLISAFILFQPGITASFFNVDHGLRYYFYFIGLLILGLVFVLQKVRVKIYH